MILATDVQYRDDGSAAVAGVLFGAWAAPMPERVIRTVLTEVEPYVPGQFFRRELPCILHLLTLCPPVDTVIVDGYVDVLPDHPGLGRHLFDRLGGGTPVVGVAKTRYHGTHALPLCRGGSNNPLYITSAGMDPSVARDLVESMSGDFRLPTLLKLADQVARQEEK